MKVQADDQAKQWSRRYSTPHRPKSIRALVLLFVTIAVFAFFAVVVIAIDYQSITNQNPVTLFKHKISGGLISNINIMSGIILVRGGYAIWKDRQRTE